MWEEPDVEQQQHIGKVAEIVHCNGMRNMNITVPIIATSPLLMRAGSFHGAGSNPANGMYFVQFLFALWQMRTLKLMLELEAINNIFCVISVAGD